VNARIGEAESERSRVIESQTEQPPRNGDHHRSSSITRLPKFSYKLAVYIFRAWTLDGGSGARFKTHLTPPVMGSLARDSSAVSTPWRVSGCRAARRRSPTPP